MGAFIPGLVDVPQWEEQFQRPQDVIGQIQRLYPFSASFAPLVMLSKAMKKRKLTDQNFNWHVEQMPDYRYDLDADIDAVQTTFTLVANAFALKIDNVLMIEATGEIVRVVLDPTIDTEIEVVRAQGDAVAAIVALASQSPVMSQLGTAQAEESNAPQAKNYQPDRYFSQTQIFREDFGISGSAKAVNVLTGDELNNSMTRAQMRILRDMEMSFLRGQFATDTSGAKERKYMKGIEQQLPTSGDDQRIFSPADAGNVSYAEVLDWSRVISTFSMSDKLVMCGALAKQGFVEMAFAGTTSRMEIGPKIKAYGLDIQQLITPFGTWNLVVHPLLSQDVSKTFHVGMETWAYVLDMNFLKYVFLKGRDLHINRNVQTPGLDGEQHDYMAEVAIQVTEPLTCGLIKGITGGKA